MSTELTTIAYLIAAVLFVFALKRMASPKTARLGNLFGAVGMLIAIVVTLLASKPGILSDARGLMQDWGWWFIIAGALIGAVVGGFLAVTVKMTAMPQMVAMFNGFGGLASGLVVFVEIWKRHPTGSDDLYLVITVAISTLIGWVTFTGSLVAFAKLQEFIVSGRPTVFPLQKIVNFALLALTVGLIVLWGFLPEQRVLIIPIAVLASVLGVLFTIPIGGADMPVVISLLNSYSGLAACATGFVLGNPGLIIAGSLVGASGIVLTRLMCVAMNRSLANVLFAAVGTAVAGKTGEQRTVKRYTPEDAAMVLDGATQVMIVPGYGMAVAQAQHAVKELADLLTDRGVTVRYAIHPVAGRMPGHMNVLLAEAEVPYEQLYDLDQANAEFEQTDVALVLGANDVINPAARTDEGCPIYGMPILDVDKARTVFICKRSLGPGFAGIDNELFYSDKTMMLFGDGKETIVSLVAAMKE
ncbi:MAG: NAD(P)(+) transhydrogenase (Re/Si-specific) subunit beta [Planctomycetota bacterium]|nr:NAD(P)(+) transhydrogenase (Re/Si-specific) subunit beta [Planctomycetota bacterium]